MSKIRKGDDVVVQDIKNFVKIHEYRDCVFIVIEIFYYAFQ